MVFESVNRYLGCFSCGVGPTVDSALDQKCWLLIRDDADSGCDGGGGNAEVTEAVNRRF